jgi:cold shock CspA family protein
MANEENFPLQISFRDIPPSPAIEARVRRNAAKLGRFHQRITSCRVVTAAPERQHHKERLYVYGFIESSTGDDVYFNRNSVLDGAFLRLKPGSKVRFVSAPGARGRSPEASTVRIVGKHNLVDIE